MICFCAISNAGLKIMGPKDMENPKMQKNPLVQTVGQFFVLSYKTNFHSITEMFNGIYCYFDFETLGIPPKGYSALKVSSFLKIRNRFFAFF